MTKGTGSGGFQAAVDEARRYAKSAEPMLIVGEPGTGKTAMAESIHSWSGRTGRFVRFPLSPVGEEVSIADLLGHARGAYTGAVAEQPGLLSAAAGGTLFLDELNGASAGLQMALLPVLDERPVRRLGDGRAEVVTARVIGATNGDLAAEVRAGRFRADLLDRFGVIRITVPPLRDRRSDIVPLFTEFLAGCRQGRSNPVKVDPEVLALVQGHSWPGNVRELQYVARATAWVAPESSAIRLEHLPQTFLAAVGATAAGTVSWAERARQAVDEMAGNKAKAARLLGVSRTRLYRILTGAVG